jgi:hypothetical protein
VFKHLGCKTSMRVCMPPSLFTWVRILVCVTAIISPTAVHVQLIQAVLGIIRAIKLSSPSTLVGCNVYTLPLLSHDASLYNQRLTQLTLRPWISMRNVCAALRLLNLDNGAWCSGRSTCVDGATITLWTEDWARPRAGLGPGAKRKGLPQLRTKPWSPDQPASSVITILTELPSISLIAAK